MDGERKHSKWPWLVLALIVLYPLSIGPAGLIVSRTSPHPDSLTRKIAVAFYQPVISICKAVGAEVQLVNYERWWIENPIVRFPAISN